MSDRKPSRHNKNKPNTIKMSCKVDLFTWKRTKKKAESENKEVSQFIRDAVMSLVWDVPLDENDMKEINDIMFRKENQ